MKDLSDLIGFLNRHVNPLPDYLCNIEIVIKEAGKPLVLQCSWTPYKESDYKENDQPSKGYLGTARAIATFKGLGFHAWEQNNSEFIHYKIIE